MNSEDALSRGTRRRGILVSAIAGLVIVGLGAVLFYLGMTFEEPAERIATRSVPRAAPIALSVGGAIVALGGLVVAVRGMRRR